LQSVFRILYLFTNSASSETESFDFEENFPPVLRLNER
jgi:hypothetical protein